MASPHRTDRHHLCRQAGLGCESVRRFDAIFQTPAVGIALVSLTGHLLDTNEACQQLLGYDAQELSRLTVQELTHPEDVAGTLECYHDLLEGTSDSSHLEKRYVRRDGSVVWGQLSLSLVHAQDGSPLFYLAVLLDITRRKEAEQNMLRRSAYLQLLGSVAVEANQAATFEAALLKCITLVCSQTDWQVGHLYVPSREHPLLFTSGSLWYLEDPVRFRTFQEHSEATLFSSGIGIVGQVHQTGRPQWWVDLATEPKFMRTEGAERVGLKTGFAFPLLVGSEIGAVLEFFTTERRDIDDELLEVMSQIGTQLGRVLERKRAQEALEVMSCTDAVTRLPNRVLFSDRLSQAIGSARRQGHEVGILYLNLDRFQFINDTMGHDRGDELLRMVAERLATCVRDGDTVGRLGGDEFTILLPDLQEAPEVTVMAEEILASLNRPFVLDGHEFVVTPSIGIATFPADGRDAAELVRNAAAAMHRAKSQRNEFQRYSPVMNGSSSEKLLLEQELRKAIERRELLVHYQPQVSLKTRRIVGAEALVRWQHPELGLVSPAKFIPLAEETGLIVPITEWVLRTVCEQGQRWKREGYEPVRLSVNLSGCHFRRQNLVRMVEHVLRQTGFDPRYLELELTESILMEDVEETIATLKELRALGIHFSIDDFGTGYSSLSYLKRFPIQNLKIDRSFVLGIGSGEEDRSIVTAIIALAHSLQLQVTAEGVEDDSQLTFLAEKGCDMVQGYLFSKPVPAEAFRYLLSEGRFAS